MAIDQQQLIETQVREIIADWKKTHDFIQKGIADGILEIVKKNSESCKSQQKACGVEIVNAAYDYKKVCNNDIVAQVNKIMEYQSQTSENKKILENYIDQNSGQKLSEKVIAAKDTRLDDLGILRQIHKKTNQKTETTRLKSILNSLATIFFKKTSIFEHKVNKFIDQIPIQVFVLSNETGDKIGFFSYDGDNCTVLKTIASTTGMTLNSGSSISFNMSMTKAQKIIETLAKKYKGNQTELRKIQSQNFGGSSLNSLTGSTDPGSILNNNLANFIQIQTHQQASTLKPAQLKALATYSEFKQLNKPGILQKYGEQIKTLQQTDQIQISKIQEFTQTLNDMVTAQEQKKDSKGNPVYTYATKRRVIGLNGADTHDQSITETESQNLWRLIQSSQMITNVLEVKKQEDLNGKKIQGLWTKIQSSTDSQTIKKTLGVKKKADLYGKIISDEHKAQYFNLNKGQLKEAFFGYYFQLEHGFTTVNSGEDTYLIYREDFPSYIAAMDNVRARLWGDYNAKIGDTTYAVSVKSEGAGMDIKQFIQLADLIINQWKTFIQQPPEIKTDPEVKGFKELLKNKLKQLQIQDVAEGVAQKSEILSDVASYHVEGEKNLSVNQMLTKMGYQNYSPDLFGDIKFN